MAKKSKNKTYIQTTMSFNEEDRQRREVLRKMKYSTIDVWRFGAEMLISSKKEKEIY